MTLAPGSRIGSYEIVSSLGVGGMGEVYRARDPKLKREVAIKVLPTDVAGNPERLGRFEREAHVLASLNHPHIASIYGLEDSGSTPALVMELVEGESLAAKIQRGALPVDEAVAVARQIADALEFAHERGIVHRDLKPANIVVARDGTVKVLDFGLAKAITGESGDSSSSDATHSPTLTSPATRAGVILGTAAYMAPEQARGKSVDRRADIWAFGVVLFEMLTGRRMFEGETVSDTIAAILTRAPDFSLLPATTPTRVKQLLARCLDRDPKQRLRDIGEARIMLNAPAEPAIAASPATAAPRTSRSTLLPWIVAGIAVVAAGAWTFMSTRKAPPTTAPIKYSQRTFRAQSIFQALYAPDGESVVFSSAPTGNTPFLYSLRKEYTDPLKISEAPLQLLSISSKGELAVLTNPRWVAHRMCTGTLARMPISGGAPREIMEDVFQASWNPDGSDLAIVRLVEGVVRLEYPAGKVLFQTGGYVSDLRFSPDGKHIAYFEHPAKFDDRGEVAIIDMNGKRTELSRGYWGLEGIAWSSDGSTVYFSGGTGYADFSIYASSLSGEVRVAAQSAGGIVMHDVSPNGQWIATRDDLRKVMLARAPGQTQETDIAWQELSEPIDISRDGRSVIFTEAGTAAGSNYQTCMRGTDGSPVVVLGEGGGIELSGDGRWVLAGIFPNRLFAYPTGAGQAIELKCSSIELANDARWFPDGKRVLIVGGKSNEASRAYVLDFPDGEPEALTEPGLLAAYPSPDGMRLLIWSADLSWSTCRLDSPGTRTHAVGMGEDDIFIDWQEDGRGVYVATQRLVPNAITAVDIETGKRRTVMPLDPKMPGVLYIRSVALTPDEKSYVYGVQTYVSRLYTMEGAH